MLKRNNNKPFFIIVKCPILIVFTLRNIFTNPIKNQHKQYTTQNQMIFNISIFIWIIVLHQMFSHILIPPFLPDGFQNQYFEQKFRISQLDAAQFKISGLPKDIFWTSNGTIFGTPSIAGQYTLQISYDSLTEFGNYETALVINNESMSNNSKANNNQTNHIEFIFPQNLIFQKGNEQEIELKLKNAIGPISWKFKTLPSGVTQKIDGKLKVKIQKQGIYVVRVQANDIQNNEIQACVTLNVQSSKLNFTQTYAQNTLYISSQNVNRLMQITKKDTQVTKQLNEASKILGQQNQILKDNEEAFKRISNNLIQLQNEVKIVSQQIQDSLKEKKVKQQKLKVAYQILTNAEDSLNLALIQQQSNNNLLNDSQVQKAKAQVTYDKAAKDLQTQLTVLSNIDKKIQQKKDDKDKSSNLLTQKKARYTQLGDLIVSKQKQSILTNQQVIRIYQEALRYQSDVKSQKIISSQQGNKYSSILNNLNAIDSDIEVIENSIQNLTQQRQKTANQISRLETILKNTQLNDLFNLQQKIKDNDLAIQSLLISAIQQWNNASYESTFVNDYLNQIKFGGCSIKQYPSVQGLFTIKKTFLKDSYYQSESGHRILYENCTTNEVFKIGDSVIVSGFIAQGIIHANKIVLQ